MKITDADIYTFYDLIQVMQRFAKRLLEDASQTEHRGVDQHTGHLGQQGGLQLDQHIGQLGQQGGQLSQLDQQESEIKKREVEDDQSCAPACPPSRSPFSTLERFLPQSQ